MRAFITARFTEEGRRVLEPHVADIRYGGYGRTRQKLTERELVEELHGVELLLIEFEPVTRFVLDNTDLRLIGCCRNEPAANVDLQAATERGIPVLYTPGRNSVTVAEATLGVMLALCRNIAKADYLLKHTNQLTESQHGQVAADSAVPAEWCLDETAPFWTLRGPELHGKTLGLIGFGGIGQAVALRAKPFGMRVVVYDPFASSDTLREFDVTPMTLKELLEESDFVSLHCKVTPETIGLIGSQELRLMKPTAYLINTARAVIVEQEALLAALHEGWIAGAALDVYHNEPLRSDDPILKAPNTVLTPHIAGASADIPARHSAMIAEDVVRVLQGRQPLYVANPEVL